MSSSKFSRFEKKFNRTVVSEIDSDAWNKLTKNMKKKTYFNNDSDFRESYADFTEQDSAGIELLHNTTYLLFKPEAIYGRRISKALEYLEDNDFHIIYISFVDYDECLIHRLWRYQINVASLDRIRLQTRFNCRYRTILILLRDASANRQVPASIRLKSLKGSAQSDGRSKSSLRSILNSSNLMMNFIHSPDEPADIIRELNILLTGAERTEAYQAMISGSRISANIIKNAVSSLQIETPPHDLDPCGSYRRLKRLVRDNQASNPSVAKWLLRFLGDVQTQGRSGLPICDIIEKFKLLGICPDKRDIYCYLSRHIEADRDDIERDLSGDGLQAWNINPSVHSTSEISDI